jgi:hypothetical protein
MADSRLDAIEQRIDHLEAGSGRSSMLAQFHAAEYSAIMARISAWAQLQYAAWPIVIGALAILVQMDTVEEKYRWWLSLLVTLAVYVAYQGTMVGMLAYVLLIERHVRPRAASLVKTDEFWLHERVWRKNLPSNPAWSPSLPPIISFVAIMAVTAIVAHDYGLHAMDWRDGSALLAALVLWAILLRLTRNGAELSDAITETCAQSKIEIPDIEKRGSRRRAQPHGRSSGSNE